MPVAVFRVGPQTSSVVDRLLYESESFEGMNAMPYRIFFAISAGIGFKAFYLKITEASNRRYNVYSEIQFDRTSTKLINCIIEV